MSDGPSNTGGPKCPLCNSTRGYATSRVWTCTACNKSVDIDESDDAAELRRQLAEAESEIERLRCIMIVLVGEVALALGDDHELVARLRAIRDQPGDTNDEKPNVNQAAWAVLAQIREHRDACQYILQSGLSIQQTIDEAAEAAKGTGQ